jgi:dihydroneopterin aldolase
LKKNTQILKIKGMEFFACHGVYAFEKNQATQFVVDIEVQADFSEAMNSDALRDALDYEIIYNKVSKIMGQSCNLIEYITKAISEEILPMLGADNQLRIEIHKMNPPIQGKVKETAFEAIFVK